MRIIDTHAHLCDEAFEKDLEDVLARAAGAGVAAVVAVGESLDDARRNLTLCKAHPLLRPAAGLYPTRLDLEAAAQMVGWIRNHRDRLRAIGEVGLDFWAVQSPEDRDVQVRIFSMFVDLSLELDLPLNVHSRSAGRHVIDILLARKAQKVHLHAFDGKYGTAIRALEAGYFFSIPPSVVRSRQKQKLVKNLPLTRLMVESDSPVLGPEPGERNEPANTVMAIEAIAAIKGESTETVAGAVYENTCRLYGEFE